MPSKENDGSVRVFDTESESQERTREEERRDTDRAGEKTGSNEKPSDARGDHFLVPWRVAAPA